MNLSVTGILHNYKTFSRDFWLQYKALEAVMEGITSGLKKSGKVTLVGFGTFTAKKREARTGRNPQTGETVKIEARVVPGFKAGSKLKDSLN